MIDAGGGTYLRFGEARASLNDLSLVAISHLHPDHVSDLAALLWLSDAARDRPLKMVGPSAGGVFPGIDTFLHRLFDSSTGAFPILAGSLRQPGRGVPLDVQVVDATGLSGPATALAADGIEVTAIGVPHSSTGVAVGTTPSIAYRVQVGGRSAVFSSDQNGSADRFVDFARDADLLVMHFAVSEQAPEALRDVHATPTVVGRIARQAGVGRLVLSHIIDPPAEHAAPLTFSGPVLEASVAQVMSVYSGPLDVASDLQCFPIE
jgi:ribonuclease BN (tRNA processing enzyme)